MEKLKVLHVVGHLGKGGDSTAIFNIMHYMKHDINSNIQFDFLTHNGYDLKVVNELRKNHEVYVIENDARKMNPIKYYKVIKNILRENKYDCIHFHTSFQSCIGLFAAKKEKVKIRICHSHTSEVQRKCNLFEKKIILPVCKLIIDKLANVKVACSNEAASNLFFKNSNYQVIYNGIDFNKIKVIDKSKVETIKSEIKYIEKDIIVGQVGRFSNMKNQEYTVMLAEKMPDVKFVLLGDGENFEKIRKQILKLNLKNIFLLGKVFDVNNYMSLFNCLLMPSKYGEGLPVTLIEQQIINPNCVCVVNSNITKESNLGCVKFINIKDINEWMNTIYHCKKNDNTVDNIQKFNIENTYYEWIKIYK